MDRSRPRASSKWTSSARRRRRPRTTFSRQFRSGGTRLRQFYMKVRRPRPSTSSSAGQYPRSSSRGAVPGFTRTPRRFSRCWARFITAIRQFKISEDLRRAGRQLRGRRRGPFGPCSAIRRFPSGQAGLRLAFNIRLPKAAAPGASRPVSAPLAIGLSAVGRRALGHRLLGELRATSIRPTRGNARG